MRSIEDFYFTTDPDYALGIPDYYPAICRAQSKASAGNTKYPYLGFTLFFEAKQYHFSKPIELIRNMHLMGSGGSLDNPTIFTFPENSHGIIVHSDVSYRNKTYVKIELMGDFFEDHKNDFSNDLLNGEKYGKNAQGSIIERIELNCDASKVPPADAVEFTYDSDYSNTKVISTFEDGYFPDFRPHGITAFARVTIRDVSIIKFACHAIYFWGIGAAGSNVKDRAAKNKKAEDQKQQSANVIQSKVDNCLLSGCGGDGVHIFGGAASSCIINSVTTAHLGGCSFVDFSRLGNNFIACNSNTDPDRDPNIITDYFRPQNLTLPNLNDDTYIKRIIKAWYYDIVDDNLNILNKVKYDKKVVEIKETSLYYLIRGHSIFIDCYAEGGKSYLSPSNIVIGSANLGNLGTPAKLDSNGQVARFENGVVAYGSQYLDKNRKVQKNFTITTLGGGNEGDSITSKCGSAHLSLEFDFTTDPNTPNNQEKGRGYRLYYQNTFLLNPLKHFQGWWELVNFQKWNLFSDYDNAKQCPVRLSTIETDVGTGQVWFENGFYIGTFQEPQQNRRIKITTGIKIPTDDKKVIKIVKLKIGDRVLNTDPDPTDTNPNLLENKSYAGWIYTKVGWKPYGKIEM
jgi:hypothetical protein